MIQTKVNYVVQEAVIVIKDIFRKYPNKYESIIGTLCENLDTLDEPEAKASMVWIIGRFVFNSLSLSSLSLSVSPPLPFSLSSNLLFFSHLSPPSPLLPFSLFAC